MEVNGQLEWESGWVAPGVGAASRDTFIASAGGRPNVLWTWSPQILSENCNISHVPLHVQTTA